jgi:hypothetical protein
MTSDAGCQAIAWLFLATNTGRLLAYLPQIVATLRCEAGARSVSVLTWSYFALAHFSALLYALYVLRDARSALIFAGNLAVTLALVAIILWKRRCHRSMTDTSSFPATVIMPRPVRRPASEWPRRPLSQSCRP